MEPSEKKLSLKKGITYKLCTCGLSKNLPFCDEAHKEFNEEHGTNYKSLKLTPKEDVEITASCKNWEKVV
jgi:CDGSH-type Zn-finger protein